MTSTYKRLDQINPDLFRSLILGSDDSQSEQGQAGIMAPRPRPEGLGVRDIDTTPALEDTLLAEVARGMGRSAIDRERVANAVVPAMPVDPNAEMVNPWFSLVPITDFLFRDKTEEAIPTMSSMGAAPRMPTSAATAPEMPEVDPVSAEGSTQGVTPVSQQEGDDDRELTDIMLEQLSVHEGRIPYPYRDSRGLWTIGVGHLIGDGSDEALAASEFSQYSEDNPMPDEAISELFREDYDSHVAIAESYSFFDDMSIEGKRAIIDLTYNMGDFLNRKKPDGTYMWANLRRQLENGEWDAAADNLLNTRYARQVGNRAVTVANLLRQAGD